MIMKVKKKTSNFYKADESSSSGNKKNKAQKKLFTKEEEEILKKSLEAAGRGSKYRNLFYFVAIWTSLSPLVLHWRTLKDTEWPLVCLIVVVADVYLLGSTYPRARSRIRTKVGGLDGKRRAPDSWTQTLSSTTFAMFYVNAIFFVFSLVFAFITFRGYQPEWNLLLSQGLAGIITYYWRFNFD